MSLNPNSASPVLKTQIEIALDAHFPYTMDRADFTVRAVSKDDSSYFKPMNVISVDDSAKTMTVMFGGAYSGDYLIEIYHAEYRTLDPANMDFTVGARVSSISTNTVSIHGGTEITITGTNFGSEITDNPV